MGADAYIPIEIGHRELFQGFLELDHPQTSELTFTNLYMWRHHYRPLWSQQAGCLLVILRPADAAVFGLPPIGPGDKGAALVRLVRELAKLTPEPTVRRVGEDFVTRHVDRDRFKVVPDRDNSDYVYLAADLIGLSGRKYHRKKNHLNRFLKNYRFEYRTMDADLVEDVLEMQERWCQLRECVLEPGLLSEDYAVREALTHFQELQFQGGAIEIGGKIEAFCLGEALNPDTAVIHVEKADPEIPDLYVAINQLFCRYAWSDMTYINREQDLGIEGLRRAKESYGPHHMVNKYTLVPK
jgi:hypothetical protein